MEGSLSKAISGLFLQSFLTQVKFMASSKLSLKSRLSKSWDAKASKIRSVMKWWSKCISVEIAKTASRNVAFKVAKMREAIMEDQDEFLMRNSEHMDVDRETNNRAQLEDVGQNARRLVYRQSRGWYWYATLDPRCIYAGHYS